MSRPKITEWEANAIMEAGDVFSRLASVNRDLIFTVSERGGPSIEVDMFTLSGIMFNMNETAEIVDESEIE